MKNAKKLIVTILALSMVMTLGVSALADAATGSITVENAEINRDYKLYKAFDLKEETIESTSGTQIVYIYTTNNTNLVKLIEAYGSVAPGATDDGSCPYKIVNSDSGVYTIQHKNSTNTSYGVNWLNRHLLTETKFEIDYTPKESGDTPQNGNAGTYTVTAVTKTGTDTKGQPVYEKFIVTQGLTATEFAGYLTNLGVSTPTFTEVTEEGATKGHFTGFFTLPGWASGLTPITKKITNNNDGKTELVFDNLPYGYYLMTPPDGTQINLTNVDKNVKVNSKVPTTPGNPVKEQSKNTVVVGEKITYTSMLLGRKYRSQDNGTTAPVIGYRIVDTYSSGLTFDGKTGIKSVKLYRAIDKNGNDTAAPNADGTVKHAGFINDNLIATIADATSLTAPAVVSEPDEYNEEATYTSGDGDKYAYQQYLSEKKAYDDALAKAYTLTATTDGTFEIKFNVAKTVPVYDEDGKQKFADEQKKQPLTDTVFYYGDESSYYIVVEYEMTVDEDILADNLKVQNKNKDYYSVFNGEFTDDKPVDPETPGTEVPGEPKVYAYIVNISLRKIKAGTAGTDADVLSGATFVLSKKEGGKEYFYKLNGTPSLSPINKSSGDYTVEWVEDSISTYRDTIKENDKATIIGADNKYQTPEFIGLKEGTYYLYEITGPAGYNPQTQPWTITITVNEAMKDDGTFAGQDTGMTRSVTYSVESGTEGSKKAVTYQGAFESKAVSGGSDTITISGNTYYYYTAIISNGVAPGLPTTGGAGTTLLITIGSVLFLAAAVVLVTKKRMYNAG